ncbi:agamous-like MADS-box protein AGL82 isoform X2 [Primulina eburnea]|uniref:agamous-like MADS-box protein AGL82 isoform X2 n=1 Tax=Primulina eburnea TaxID=1245227 RepID=UPI003C6C3AF9
MGRAKLRLELLSTEKGRRKTYEIRRKGLKKKAEELSTLCGVDLCMIIHPPPLKNEEIEPFVWSNDPGQVANLIESHKLSSLGDGYFSRSKTYNLSSFYKDQTRKVEEEIEKVKKTIREVKYPNWDQQYDSFSEEELRMFARVLTAKVEFTKETIELFKERKDKVPESSFLMNIPRIDENLDSGLGRELEQHQFPTYFDAQSYLENQRLEQHQFPSYFDAQSYNLENQRLEQHQLPTYFDAQSYNLENQRLEQQQFPTYFDAQSYLENQRRTMMFNNGASFSENNPYDHNVMDFAPLMSYDMQIVANSVHGYEQELMISPDCFPQLYSGFHPSLGSY